MTEQEENAKRKEDERRCEIVNRRMDIDIYTNPIFSKFKRINVKGVQVLGMDVVFEAKGKYYICDEKAATDYINKKQKLSTFCLELGFLNRNLDPKEMWNKGWFVNEDNINNAYFFIWIDEAKTDDLSGGEDDILLYEVALVEKDTIVKYFEKKGWTIPNLIKKEHKIRGIENENGEMIYDTNLGEIDKLGYRFYYSKNLKPEEPINLLLPREYYRENAIFHAIIDRRK